MPAVNQVAAFLEKYISSLQSHEAGIRPNALEPAMWQHGNLLILGTFGFLTLSCSAGTSEAGHGHREGPTRHQTSTLHQPRPLPVSHPDPAPSNSAPLISSSVYGDGDDGLVVVTRATKEFLRRRLEGQDGGESATGLGRLLEKQLEYEDGRGKRDAEVPGGFWLRSRKSDGPNGEGSFWLRSRKDEMPGTYWLRSRRAGGGGGLEAGDNEDGGGRFWLRSVREDDPQFWLRARRSAPAAESQSGPMERRNDGFWLRSK